MPSPDLGAREGLWVPPLDSRPGSPALYLFPDASLVHKSPDPFGAAAAQSLSLARSMLAISGHLDSDDDRIRTFPPLPGVPLLHLVLILRMFHLTFKKEDQPLGLSLPQDPRVPQSQSPQLCIPCMHNPRGRHSHLKSLSSKLGSHMLEAVGWALLDRDPHH
ncbi:tsc22 domain family protein 4-like [Lynx pardinus]|uniref:Tsc22 domain family protein 4-like n=1 Tax=Lynx pardinus TaxID=191816 RepID=A0A485MKP1_LYNPA|nr:tsc22 domain family protein 4-like [Lynx pardinus]